MASAAAAERGSGGGGGGPYDSGGANTRLLLTSERLALERLIRVVLGLPGHPAVLMYEAFSWSMAKTAVHGFGLLPQDSHAVLAQYYGEIQVHPHSIAWVCFNRSTACPISSQSQSILFVCSHCPCEGMPPAME